MLVFRNLVIAALSLGASLTFAQTQHSNSEIVEGNVPMELSKGNMQVVNQGALSSFFEKLQVLDAEKDGRLRIIHIGDSHIQAGIWTGKNRDLLQSRFGNAGLGFSFPHRLAKSNGIKEARYSSTVPWEGKRNIYATEGDVVGVSGFSLNTDHKDFAIALNITESRYFFNTIKLISAESRAMYTPAKPVKPVQVGDYVIEKKTHVIKSGESLSVIARKYQVSVGAIKAANNLRSDIIRAGAKLEIPVKTKKSPSIDRSNFELMSFQEIDGQLTLKFDAPQESLWLLANDYSKKFSVDGFMLENDAPGVTYSAIGVNGAKFSDYNKTPLFFKQLSALQADLFVISLGTNEAHDNLDLEKYKEYLGEFIQNIRSVYPDTPILLTTPHPSLLKRRYPNTYSESYAQFLVNSAEEKGYAVWDLFHVFGGKSEVIQNYQKGLVTRDYVHYTEKGYTHTGELFIESLMNAFDRYNETIERK